MQVPALCDTCGAVFPSDITIEDPAAAIAADGRAWPCPVCRRQGVVHGGVFHFLASLIEILSAPERTSSELSRLVEVLSDAFDRRQNPAEVVARVYDEVPELAAVAALLPAGSAGFSAHVSMTVAVSVLVWQVKGDSAVDSTVTVEQALNHIFNEMNLTAKRLGSRPMQSVGRNDPCPCGSGRRFKRCCGALA